MHAHASNPHTVPLLKSTAPLRFIGYELNILRTYPRRSAFVAAIDKFTKRAVAGSILVFYYAGHGIVTSNGHHCMMTSDYDIAWPEASDAAVEVAGYGVEQALQRILDAADGCRLIALLDTCRQLACIPSSRGEAVTVAARPAVAPHLELHSSSETLVCHACRLTDNAGPASRSCARNGIYTSQLLQVSAFLLIAAEV